MTSGIAASLFIAVWVVSNFRNLYKQFLMDT